MTQPAIQVDHVYKKFRKGEMHDSLRDLIPSIASRLIGRGPKRSELSSDREFWALQDVSFEVPRGACMGIIGPNGAGKSTMLKLLSRIIRPNRGTYHVTGRVSALIEVGAGFHNDLTGRENIYLNGTILGMSHKEIQGKEEQIVEFAGVKDFIDTPVKRYSSGMKARLGFAVAAHLEPDVLLVDEVLSVGDAKFRAKCMRHMRDLIRSDVTVVFISHLLDQIRMLCPNTVVLDHGKVIYNGATDGAIRVYLDALTDDPGAGESHAAPTDGEIRNIRICNERGEETIEWTTGKPAVLEFDVVLHKPVAHPAVLVNLSTVGGVYIGTLNSRRDAELGRATDLPATLPIGTHPVRVTIPELPLADGDYTLEFKLHAGETYQNCLWAIRQPRAVAVRGQGLHGALVDFESRWEASQPPSPVTVNR